MRLNSNVTEIPSQTERLTIDNVLDERRECDAVIYYGESFFFRIEVFSQVQRKSLLSLKQQMQPAA